MVTVLSSIVAALRNLLPFVVTATLLSACSGGGSLVPAKPTATSNAPGQGTLDLTISIPHPASASGSKRRPAYVSSSTESIAIAITQGTATVLQEAVGLTPATNPNCTTGSATTCAISIGLAAGAYTATFSTYDGPVVSHSASGNLLSQGQSIPITVVAGHANTVTATLDGVPASITIAPSSGSTITGTQSGGFNVPYTAQPLTIEAFDADGNLILGPGAPTFTVTATATKFAVTQPTQGSPNTITLAATGGGAGTLAVTATPPDGGFSCSASGVVCTASASIATPPHTLYVSNGNNVNVTVYQSLNNITWTQTNTLALDFCFSNFGPYELAADANGDLAVASGVFGCLDVFTPPYSGPVSPPNGGFVIGVAFTASREFLYTDGLNLYAIEPPYSGSNTASVGIPGTAPGQPYPYNLVVDSANDAIVSTQGGNDGTFLIASPYTAITKTLNASNDTGALAIGADNTVFIGTYSSEGQILVDAPPYTASPTTITLPNAANESPQALAVTPSGNLWVVTGDHIYEFTKPFSASSTPTVAQANTFGGTTPNEIASDTNGDLIVTTNGSTVSIINSAGTTIGTVTANVSGAEQVFYVR
jgi:hypothetical protein